MPQHLLNQQESLILIFAPAEESSYVEKSGVRLFAEKDTVKQIALLKLLWFLATAAGDEIIKRFGESATTDTKAREVVRTSQKSTEELRAMPAASSKTVNRLRSERRKCTEKN